MHRIIAAACCLALCSAPGLAQKKAAAAPMSDQQFVNFAAQTDMVEANLGKEAQNVAAKQAIKDYGGMLVSDHTMDYHQLWEAANQANLTVPNAIGTKQDKMMIDPLVKLKGPAFDRDYLHKMILGHTKALAIYKKEAMDAQNPAIKSYAEQAIPGLQKHLKDAQAIARGKTPSNMNS